MALKTLGTAANNTLVNAFVVGTNDLIPADVATLMIAILNDQINGRPLWPGGYSQTGLLSVPNRGVLRCLPGDFVATDPATGFPILLSAAAAAGASWVHS